MWLLMLLIGIVVAAETASATADLSRIDEYLHEEMALNSIPGASVAIVRRGEIVYAEGFGVSDTTTGDPMRADTLVDIASVSKPFTALAVAQLDREGRIDLDAPITRYLPELGDAFARIKLLHLIRHRSGLTRQDDARLLCCGARQGKFDLDVVAARLSNSKRRRKNRTRFEYANSNYVLLAAVIERASGQSFAQYMRDAVFRPLGMLRTTLDIDAAREWGLAAPHERSGCQIVAVRESFQGWPGSSLVKSTAHDMGRYLLHVLGRSSARGSAPYDRGWFIRRVNAWPSRPHVWEHGGDTLGGNTAAIVVPEWKMGAVVLLNTGARRATSMARGILAHVAGLSLPRAEKSSVARGTKERACK